MSGATPGRFILAGASTIGRAEEVSNVSVSPRNAPPGFARSSRFFAITANGFSLRYFRFAELAHRRSVPCIAGEVISAESLYRDDIAGRQHRRGAANARFAAAGRRVADLQVIVGPATGAGDGLRVKTPIVGIVILAGAVFIERPEPHRRVGPVVRQRQDNGVARAAIGAVDVGIVIAPGSAGSNKLAQAIVANRQVRRDASGEVIGVVALALANREIVAADWTRKTRLRSQ